MSKPVRVQIADITLDAPTQPRVQLDEETVRRYQEMDALGSPQPPADLFRDGPYLIMADGRHRLEARVRNRGESIEAVIHDGNATDALLFAIRKNLVHGKAITTEDKANAIKMLLATEQWKDASSNWIAELLMVSNKFVDNVRASLGQTDGPRRGKDGVLRKKRKAAPRKKEREAGDDTEEEKAEAAKPRPGKELLNFPKARTNIGRLARTLTAIGNVFRGERHTEEFKNARTHLNGFVKAFVAMQKRIEKK